MKEHFQNRLLIILLGILFLSIIAVEASNSQEVINKIVAKVNESIITLHDLNKRLEKDSNYAKLYTTTEKSEYKKMILDSIVVDSLLLKKAEELDITINDNLLNLQLMELYNAKSLDELKITLKDLGVDFHEAREWISNSLKVERLLAKEVYNKNQITQHEVDDYSEQLFDNIEVHARQILIKIPEGSDEESVRKLEEKAKMIHDKLSNGEDFIELSIQYSDSQNKEQGGDFGYIRKGGLPKEFEKSLFSLEKGQISDIIKSDIGFHILQAEDIRKIEGNPDKLKEKIKKERETALKKEYIERL
ncbi:peptidylprolyl isomerase, partial [bacterium]|nr:peptidylprolyl isomerase [bacterium]